MSATIKLRALLALRGEIYMEGPWNVEFDKVEEEVKVVRKLMKGGRSLVPFCGKENTASPMTW